MSAISTASEERQANLFEAIFLSKTGRWVTHLAWLVAIVWIMFVDQNPYPVMGGVLWIASIVLFIASALIYYGIPWTPATSEGEPVEFKHIWFFFPFSLLMMMNIGLFVAGDLSHAPGYVTQQNRLTGVVRVNAANEFMVLHMPLVETNSFWTVGQTVKANSVSTTADGKRIVAKLEVDLEIDDNASTFGKLGARFGGSEAYKTALQKAVEAQFAKTVAQYTLANMPNTLMLEDLVGTRIGLEGLFTTWTGAFKISEVHRYADNK